MSSPSESWPAALGAKWNGALAYAGRIPGNVFSSLSPKTETEAQIVNAQLDLLRTSLKFFDYLLPLAGAVIVAFDRWHGQMIGVWWIALILNCAINEIVLNRPVEATNVIARARIRSRQQVVICFVLAAVWSSVAYWLWHPSYAANYVFVELILCCTLAAVATMSSLHAASSAVPLLMLSAGVIAVPTLNRFSSHLITFGLGVIFVALMLGHAWVIQLRTVRMLRLENERSELIAHLRLAKAESDAAQEKAVAASQAKSEFLANMSHELRTPLNAIIGFSDIVRSKAFGEATDKYAEYGGFIHQSGNRLLDLIDDILDLAKIEAGRKVLLREPVDLAGLLASQTQKWAEAGAAVNVSVTASVADGLPLIDTDVRAMRQILENLLSNAVKYTPAEGRVEISAAVNADNELVLAVADTGIGIDAADQAHIFDRFGRGRPHVTTAQRGTGLGLAIVKGLVDMHGGRIELESARGEGTRIAIVLPVKAKAEQPSRRVA